MDTTSTNRELGGSDGRSWNVSSYLMLPTSLPSSLWRSPVVCTGDFWANHSSKCLVIEIGAVATDLCPSRSSRRSESLPLKGIILTSKNLIGISSESYTIYGTSEDFPPLRDHSSTRIRRYEGSSLPAGDSVSELEKSNPSRRRPAVFPAASTTTYWSSEFHPRS